MIRITSFIHREALQDLIGRWMLDRLKPSDTMDLMRLVHFNSVYVARYLPILTERVLGAFHGGRLSSRMSLTKGDIKDQLIAHLPDRALSGSERASRLIAAYHADPGLYYRETPFRGMLYFADMDGRAIYVGSNRIKRIRRLAEKSARKVVDWLYEEIKRQSDPDDGFGVAAPAASAVSAAGPRSSQSESEQRVLAMLRRLRETGSDGLSDHIEINDVAGIKVVVEPAEEERLLGVLQDLGCRLTERELHMGDYSAVNLLVDYPPDKGRILAEALPAKVIRVFRDYGVQSREVHRWFKTFVLGGEASVRVEIICSDYAETLEGEIGRCMHEDRIIRQRQRPEYQGQLAQNVEFLHELLFTLPAAPDARLDRLPVRLWDRYLPEYFDEVKRTLFHMPSVELNVD
jgi:hypothetical protein